jgi:hypothetical protein
MRAGGRVSPRNRLRECAELFICRALFKASAAEAIPRPQISASNSALELNCA